MKYIVDSRRPVAAAAAGSRGSRQMPRAQRAARVSTILPCRVSVYEHGGTTRIGLLCPKAMLAMPSDSRSLARVAAEVETATREDHR
jgi:uncharacterized protein (DUF302 family)